MGLAVRNAQPGDLPAIEALWRSFNAYLDAIDDPENIDPALFARFEALCFGPDPVCTALLAESGGAPVGYLVYHWGVRLDQVSRALFIADLFVSDTARGLGAGRALMDAARAIARTAGAQSLFWQVWNKNEKAIAFYTALGAEWLEGERTMIWAAEGAQ